MLKKKDEYVAEVGVKVVVISEIKSSSTTQIFKTSKIEIN